MWRMGDELTHLDRSGRVRMVDVGDKPLQRREAVAEGLVCAASDTLDRIEAGSLPKGEALAAARIAGIVAAKKCDELIPLCHPLPLDQATVDFDRPDPERLRITARVSTTARTGVEMEALTAVSVAALTVYDMLKAMSHDIVISETKLMAKTGGKQDFERG